MSRNKREGLYCGKINGEHVRCDRAQVISIKRLAKGDYLATLKVPLK